MFCTINKSFSSVIIIVFLLTAFFWSVGPYALSRLSAGSAWRGVYPAMTHEYFIYLAQMKAVSEGIPTSNPFFLEYKKNGYAPNLSWEIVLASIPLSLGLSPDNANMFNTFIWSFAFLCTVFYFCIRWKLSPFLCAIIPIIVFFGYSPEMMLRPAIMQIVYPTFMLFLCALLFWAEDPNMKHSSLLGITLGLSVYFYTFTMQIAVVSFGVCAVAIFFSQSSKWRIVRSVLFSLSIAGIIAIPFVLNSLSMLHNSLYKETFLRLNAVFTHLPNPKVYGTGVFFLATLFFYAFARRKFSRPEEEVFGSHEGWVVFFRRFSLLFLLWQAIA